MSMRWILLLNIIVFTTNCSAAKPLRVGVINDLNSSFGSTTYISAVNKGIQNLIQAKIDLVIAPGDFVAGQDTRKRYSDLRFEEMWKSFENNIHSKFKKSLIPFAPAPGNHDASKYIIREQKFYKDYFLSNKPNLNFVSSEMYPFYYSFIKDGVFFIALDDTVTGKISLSKSPQGIDQRSWIKKQLNLNEAKEARARIVYGHIPLYSVLDEKKHPRKFKETLSLEQYQKGRIDTLEEILTESNVSLAVFAHSHAFYPGHIKHKELKNDLHILFSPCLGSGNRFVVNRTKNRSAQGYSIIEVNNDDKITYKTYTYSGELINSLNLPETIRQRKVTINRDDLYYKN